MIHITAKEGGNHSYSHQPSPSPADLVTFNEQILNGKLHFLCSVDKRYLPLKIRSRLSIIYVLLADFMSGLITVISHRQVPLQHRT